MVADTPRDQALRLVQAGAGLAGAATGAFATLIGGQPVLAAAVGAGLTSVVGELATRVLSAREQERVGAVVEQSAASISARLMMGEQIRADDFWSGDRSTGAQITEGVLLAARDEYEERKLPYLGNLLASIALWDTIDRETANYAIDAAESLRWIELKILAMFADAERFPMPEREASLVGATEWATWTAHQSLTRLIETRAMLHYKRKSAQSGIPLWDTNMSGIEMTSAGTLMVHLMQLETIPRAELATEYAVLIREAPPEAIETE